MDLSEKKLKKIYEKNAKILNELVKQKSNKTCADCLAGNPKWASSNLGVFLCIKCAGFHRKLGSSSVKSITLDNWTQEEIENMIDGGNEKINSIYLNGSNKPVEVDLQYIRDKYEFKVFAKQTQFKMEKSDKETLSILENMGFTKKSINLKALDLAGGDVQTAIELLLSGAVGEVSSPKKTVQEVDQTLELNLPKLPTKNEVYQKEIMGDSSLSLDSKGFNPDLKIGENSDSKGDKSIDKKGNGFDTIKDDKIKQALENAMEQLSSFGFSDVSDSRAALKQARGDVEKALGILLKWKDDREKRDEIYKAKKQAEESKKDSMLLSEKPNFLGSMDNMAPSQMMGNGFNSQSNQFQTANTYQSLPQKELAGQDPSFHNLQTQPLPVQTSFQTLQSANKVLQTSQISQAIQNPQPIQNAPPASIPLSQNTIDIFSDQFVFPSSINSQPILPTNGMLQNPKSNPFASKPLVRTAATQNTFYNFVQVSNSNVTNSSNNIKQKPGFSNDLADISFGGNSVPALQATKPTGYISQIPQSNGKQNMPAQNVSGSSNPSKDTIMSLYNSPAINNTHIQNNPFMFNQQQSIQPKSQHRLSLVKAATPNPFMNMNGIPNPNDATYHYSSQVGTAKNVNYQIPNGNSETGPFSRNYQLDNYSASALGISEIFSAPPPLPSDKERGNTSLFSDLPSFKR